MADKKPLVNDAGNAVEIATGDTIPIANGGTGQTTANAALNALLPSQTGNSGEFLTTDGTDASWGAISLPSSFVGMSVLVQKTAQETVTSSTTLQSDDHLTFSIGANEEWKGFFSFALNAATAAGFKFDITAPSGASGSCAMFGNNTFTIAWVAIGTGGGVTASATNVFCQIPFSVVNATNAGNITLRWAQNASSITGTIIRSGGFLSATRTA